MSTVKEENEENEEDTSSKKINKKSSKNTLNKKSNKSETNKKEKEKNDKNSKNNKKVTTSIKSMQQSSELKSKSKNNDIIIIPYYIQVLNLILNRVTPKKQTKAKNQINQNHNQKKTNYYL